MKLAKTMDLEAISKKIRHKPKSILSTEAVGTYNQASTAMIKRTKHVWFVSCDRMRIKARSGWLPAILHDLHFEFYTLIF
jgi:hypothetical protein